MPAHQNSRLLGNVFVAFCVRYDYYGYDTRQIAVLFIVGFMSSMVFGTIAGALADKYGRRLMCTSPRRCRLSTPTPTTLRDLVRSAHLFMIHLLAARTGIAFAVIYILSCATKFYNDFWILFIGRVTGGITANALILDAGLGRDVFCTVCRPGHVADLHCV